MTVEAAMELYKKHLAHRVVIKKIKPSTEEFWHTALNSIKLSWPKLAEADVGDITAAECKIVVRQFCLGKLSHLFNNVLHALKKVFEQALDKASFFETPCPAWSG